MCSKIEGNMLKSDDVDQRDTFVESQTQFNPVNHSEIDAELLSAPNTKQTERNGSHSSVESNQSIYPWESSDENTKIEKQQQQPFDIEFLRVNRVSRSSSTSDSSKLNVKLADRAKRKSWYNIIYPTYKARNETFKRLFSEVPDNERLIVDYSCALQREILAHGRMFVSQHYLCFHANIFGWETFLTLKWRDVTALTKEKTALVIPNAILVSTQTEKYFITSFAARDKTYLHLFRIWQNALMNKPMVAQEIWQNIHNVYGDQLGLTSDDEDYIDPTNETSVPLNADMNTKITSSTTSESSQPKSIENPKSDNKKSMAPGDNSKRCSESDSDKFVSSRDNVLIDSNGTDSGTGVVATSTGVVKPKMRITRPKAELLTNENLPTDASDSTDSDDENSVPFVCTAECTSMHEGRQIVHTILPINVDSLMSLLFSKSKFFAEFHKMRKTTNMVYREWEAGDDGLKTRKMNFTVAVTQAIGPKTCNVTEIQKMRECTTPGQLYSIDMTSINAGIPYADSFQIEVHYCLVRTVDDHTMLSVYAQIKYVKSVWGVVKGFIEKNIWCGLEDFYKALLNALQSEYCLPPAKSKSRKNKRAQQKAIVEDAPVKVNFAPAVTTNVIPSDAMPPLATTKLTSQITKSSSLPVVEAPATTSRFTISMERFSIFIVVLIIVLVLLNIYLMVKLYRLETYDNVGSLATSSSSSAASGDSGRVQHNENPITSGKSAREHWLDVISQQEAVPDAELTKWEEFIKATIEMLRKIEDMYHGLNLELNSTQTDGRVPRDEL